MLPADSQLTTLLSPDQTTTMCGKRTLNYSSVSTIIVCLFMDDITNSFILILLYSECDDSTPLVDVGFSSPHCLTM